MQQSQIICASLTGITSSGLDSESDLQFDDFDDTGGDQQHAW